MKKKTLLLILLMALLAPWAVNAQSLFSEDFEGGTMPTGWTTDGPGTWSVGSGDYSTSTGAGQGTYNALIKHSTTNNVTKLITPEIDLSSVTSAALSFMHIQRSWAGDIDQLRVYYRTSSSDTWTMLAEYTAAIASWTTEEDIILPNTSSTYQLAFEHTDKYGYGVGVDNIIISQPPACAKPRGLEASNAFGHGATINWDSDADAWVVAYKKAADENFTEINVTAKPYTFSGLDPETTYNVKVKTDCGGTYSDYTSPINFTTTVACPAPTGLAATLTAGNGTIATLTWTETGEATDWVVEYGTASDLTGATSVNVSGTPSLNLTGLTAETKYYARVKADCGSLDGQSAWSSIINFEPTAKLMIGSGTATNSYLPGYLFYKHSLTQQIYTVEELGDAGLIESIDFFATAATTYQWTFKIYIVNTDKSDFVEDESKTSTDWIAVTEDDLYYSGEVTMAAGWNTFEFTEPFVYQGTQNIAIVVKTDFTENYESSKSFRVFDATAQAIRVYSDNTEYNPLNPSEYSGTILNVKNQLRIAKSDIPSCFKPTGIEVTDITAHGATFTWNSDATSWEVKFGADGRPTAVYSTTFTATSLGSETDYTFYVRANCGDEGYSEWATKSFKTLEACPVPTDLTTTDVAAFSATLNWASTADNFNVRYRTVTYQTVFEDDFEDGLGQWTILHGDDATAPSGGYWYIIDPQNGLSFDAYSGTHVASSWSWNGSEYNADNYLVTPQVDLQGEVKFYVRTNAGYPDSYEVLLSTTGNTIDDFTVTLQAMAPAPNNGEWNEVIIPLTGYTGQGYIAIHHESYDANYLVIDDFSIYQKTGGSWTEATATSTTLAITNLSEETDYEWQVQAVCGGDDGSSEWSSIVPFHTPSNCEVPSGLIAEDIDASSATLNWTGIHDSYNVRYRTAEYWATTLYFTGFNTSSDREGWTWTDGYSIYGMADPIYGISSDENYFLPMGWSTTEEATIISPELPEGSGRAVEFYHFGYNVANTFQVGYSSTTNDYDAFTWGSPIEAGSGYTQYIETITDDIKYVAFKATASQQSACVFIDDFAVYCNLVPAGSWIETTVDATTLAISDLRGKKKYEWQVQGVNASCDGGVTEWSDMATFTTEPSCLVPEDLDYELTSEGVVISWTSDATLFDIEVDGVVIEDVTNPFTFEVDPETIYEVRVRANCGDGDYSDWTDYFDFVTECNSPKAVPYTFDFDIDQLEEYYACWFAYSYNDENNAGLAYDPDDENNIVFRFSSWSNAEDYTQVLYSPDIYSETPIDFSFKYKAYSSTETFYVGYYVEGAEEIVWSDAIDVSSTDWQTYNDVLPAGTLYVVLEYVSNYQYYLYIDEFSFTEAEGVTQTIELVEGWNWVSFNLVIDDEDAAVAMLQQLEEKLGDNATDIQSMDYGTMYEDEEWFGDLDEVGVNNTQTYVIYVVNECTVVLEGTELAAAENYTIEINPGWNWIGFPNGNALDVNEAMSDFDAEELDEIQNKDGGVLYEDEWFGDFENFEPGTGYMYYYNGTETQYLVFNTGFKKSTRSANIDFGKLNKQNTKIKIVKPESNNKLVDNTKKAATKESISCVKK